MKREPKNETPFFARSLILVPCCLLRNQTETLSTQANARTNKLSSSSNLKVSIGSTKIFLKLGDTTPLRILSSTVHLLRKWVSTPGWNSANRNSPALKRPLSSGPGASSKAPDKNDLTQTAWKGKIYILSFRDKLGAAFYLLKTIGCLNDYRHQKNTLIPLLETVALKPERYRKDIEH